MTIHKKYNNGDKVWFIFDNKVANTEVANWQITGVQGSMDYNIVYFLNSLLIGLSFGRHGFLENTLFATKEELLNSL